MKVVLASTLPLGPLMLVVGVWSSTPKDSIFLMALVASLPPAVLKVLAISWSSRLPVTVTGSDQVVEGRVVQSGVQFVIQGGPARSRPWPRPGSRTGRRTAPPGP